MIFLRTICHNYEMFRSIFIIFRELLHINKNIWIINALLMCINSKQIIKIDRKMSEL